MTGLVLSGCGPKAGKDDKQTQKAREPELSTDSLFVKDCLQLGEAKVENAAADQTSLAILRGLGLLASDEGASAVDAALCDRAKEQLRTNRSLSLANAELEELGPIGHLYRLEELDLSGNPRLSQTKITAVLGRLRNLQHVSLVGLDLSDETIVDLVADHRSITRVVIEAGEQENRLAAAQLKNGNAEPVDVLAHVAPTS